ncbi:MAG TPA: TadE family protein [Candidatus Deferrimicrobiaceae bacterium]
MEFLIAGPVFLILVFTIVQLAFLLSGKGAVDTAAHFAARKFAVSARNDFRKAKAAALAEASTLCRNRIGGTYTNLTMTTLDFYNSAGKRGEGPVFAGDAYQVTLSHWVELVVPWANRILFGIVPGKKVRLGDRYFLILDSSRMVTVE